jgi:DNA repair protein RAD50
MLGRIPLKKGKAEEQLKQVEAQKEKLQSVHGPYVRLTSLEDELSAIEQERKTSMDEKKAAQNDYQKLGDQEADLKKALEQAGTLLKASDNITRLRKEIDSLTQEVVSLEDDLSVTGSTRTVHDCQKEMGDISKQKKTAQKTVDDLQKKRETARQKSYSIENKIRDFRERLTSLNHRMDIKTSLEAQMDENDKALKEHEHQAEVCTYKYYKEVLS